ncbi:MAG: type II secretion system protein [Betaproteobacteria bacterium]|nr:MAG: type II secretion system protein [Betaproteobacteria bacterium]
MTTVMMGYPDGLPKTVLSSAGTQSGFTYIGLLFLVAIVTFALSGVATVWHTMAQREREAELLFIGEQFSQAIESYYRWSPGGPQLPRSLDDLLRDDRFPMVRRHLRRIYRDPMTGSTDWGLVMEGDRIAGVHSLSKRKPIRVAGFDRREFEEAESYEDWRFVYSRARQSRRNVATESAESAGISALPVIRMRNRPFDSARHRDAVTPQATP